MRGPWVFSWLKLSRGVARFLSQHAGKTLPWDRSALSRAGRIGLALLKLRVELGMKPGSWLNPGFELDCRDRSTSLHSLGTFKLQAFLPPCLFPSFRFLPSPLGLSHNFGSLTCEQCWQLCLPVVTSWPCAAAQPTNLRGQEVTTPLETKLNWQLMIGLSPHLQPENLNAFKNTTGTFLRAGTAASHPEWAD